MLLQIQEIYEFGPFRLDPGEGRLLRGEQIVALTPKAFETLSLLVQKSGHLVKKDELIERVWHDTIVEESNLNVIIHTLRKALGDDPTQSKYIETVSKRGYRFVADVRKVPDQVSLADELTATGESLSDPHFAYPKTITPPPSRVSAFSIRHFLDRPLLRSWALGLLAVIIAAGSFFVWRSNLRPGAERAATAPAPV